MSVLGPLRRESGAGQCQTLPVTGYGRPVWSYKVIHSLWLPLLGLGVHEKDQVNSTRPDSTATESGDRSAKGPRHAEILFCLLLFAG